MRVLIPLPLQRWMDKREKCRFETHVKQLLPELYRVARSLVGESSEAEDLVHDTCVKALVSFQNAEVAEVSACRAWLHRILINTFRDKYRRAQNAPVRQPSESASLCAADIVEFAVSADPGPDELVEYSNIATVTKAAISSLAPEVRLVVTLFFINGMSYKEIAEVADCPIGTVMSRLARGRKNLRQQLHPFLDANTDRQKKSVSKPNIMGG